MISGHNFGDICTLLTISLGHLYTFMCIFAWFLLDWHITSMFLLVLPCSCHEGGIHIVYWDILNCCIFAMEFGHSLQSVFISCDALGPEFSCVNSQALGLLHFCNCSASFAYPPIFSLFPEQGKWDRLICIYRCSLLLTVFRRMSLTCKCIIRATLGVYSTVPKTLWTVHGNDLVSVYFIFISKTIWQLCQKRIWLL